ncbi:hypothetical protein ACZ87_00767 [Candidatus Erwinia dacicola]|uniref:Uncharacterized protein n=1 Tax=Candidatus Erwinia dacicola TaxID=252393 RepID=A0A328TPQ0_9GAMM|nr:hypothetical protein ACZ87_00767 [Candidatus Erwinia dacicola]
MDEVEADVLAYFGFPRAHRVKIHSTSAGFQHLIVFKDTWSV